MAITKTIPNIVHSIIIHNNGRARQKIQVQHNAIQVFTIVQLLVMFARDSLHTMCLSNYYNNRDGTQV
jgi:hypothetical protein